MEKYETFTAHVLLVQQEAMQGDTLLILSQKRPTLFLSSAIHTFSHTDGTAIRCSLVNSICAKTHSYP